MINQGNSRKRRETTKDREAEYCDDRVCPSVCLCVCLSARRELISENTRPIFARFVGILPVVVARSSSHPLPALRFVMYFRFMDDDDVMFAPQCPGVYSDTKRRALKVGLTFHAGDRTRSGVVMTESYLGLQVCDIPLS